MADITYLSDYRDKKIDTYNTGEALCFHFSRTVTFSEKNDGVIKPISLISEDKTNDCFDAYSQFVLENQVELKVCSFVWSSDPLSIKMIIDLFSFSPEDSVIEEVLYLIDQDYNIKLEDGRLCAVTFGILQGFL